MGQRRCFQKFTLEGGELILLGEALGGLPPILGFTAVSRVLIAEVEGLLAAADGGVLAAWLGSATAAGVLHAPQPR